MQKLLPKIIFIYCGLASLFITASTVFIATSTLPIVFIIFFLPVTSYFLVEFMKRDSETNILPRQTEIILILIIFVIFFGIGMRNVLVSAKKTNSSPTPTPDGLIFKSETPSPAPIMITIKISDGSVVVNVREKPTIYSKKVAEAKDGDKLIEISHDGQWYKVQINGVTGYVSNLYIKP